MRLVSILLLLVIMSSILRALHYLYQRFDYHYRHYHFIIIITRRYPKAFPAKFAHIGTLFIQLSEKRNIIFSDSFTLMIAIVTQNFK